MTTGKYSFIKLEQVILRNFSLYTKNGSIYEVNEEINSGVYCLAGANGLGKTTFLNAINYGLTGIVLEPNRSMYSPSEIVKENKVFTDGYFSGRIAKKDQKKAEIEITFSVNGKYFRISRGFFDREELRSLEIYSLDKQKKSIPILSTKGKSPSQLNELYKSRLAQEIGLTDFDYFMFYQLYVFTFDETRRMIFWDERASSNALAIAFNSDPQDANKMADLVRRMEKHESNGRNTRWQATQIKNKIEELSQKVGKKNAAKLEKLEEEYNRLFKDQEKFEKIFSNNKTQLDTLLKKQSQLNSEIMHLRREHTKLFSRYSKPRSTLIENTNIQLALKKHECCICGSQGNYIIEKIEKNIHGDKCPLCDTAINSSNSAEQNKLLKAIEKNDAEISNKSSQLDDLFEEMEGKRLEVDKAEIELQKIKSKIGDFEEDYPDVSFNRGGDENLDSLLSQYRKQYDLLDTQAKDEYKKRDKLKPEYNKLLTKVETSYKDAEKHFVPVFKQLAKSFIGYDLNIHPQRENKSIRLVLELKDTARTDASQLSESQRFFLDIALRMSLAIFLSKKNSPATMFVDTPEGSLDIAYESRVGNMFADFVTTYNQNLFMTANINPSQLLISLAEKCGKNKMKFRRMLDWTDLSVIQKEGEQLFKKVYENIEKALNKRN
jgi:DNA repair exonuclease SbcCD ATPase subunit